MSKMRMLSFFILLLLFSCSESNNNNTISPLVDDKADSIQKEDRIDTIVHGLGHLRINKVSDGINVIYDYKNKPGRRVIHIDHPNFSDIVFPKLSVSVVTKGNVYKREQFCIINDSLLVLPIIGISNRLHIYIVDLSSESVYHQDIRTFFSYVWVNTDNFSFITSSTPEYNDSTIVYELTLYKIMPQGIVLVRKKEIEVKNEIDEDIDQQYKVVRQLL